MAKIHSRLLTPAVIYTLLHLFLLPITTTPSSSNIHDLLKSRGLPAGLFPKNAVKSYDLDEDGHLQVYLDEPCVAKFETRVLFDSVVRANLSYGGLIGVEGLSQEELFLWLPVKDIIVYDPASGLILFDIGVAHKQMSLSLFEEPPLCEPQGIGNPFSNNAVNDDLQVHLSERQHLWDPPDIGALKINSDASFIHPFEAAAAAILRNEEGSMIEAVAEKIKASSPEEAEAKAVRMASNLALKYKDIPISIESDAKNIIDAVTHGTSTTNWKTTAIVEDIRRMVASSPNISFGFVRREANKPCDWVAKKFLHSPLPWNWTANPPSELRNLLDFDACNANRLRTLAPTGVG